MKCLSHPSALRTLPCRSKEPRPPHKHCVLSAALLGHSVCTGLLMCLLSHDSLSKAEDPCAHPAAVASARTHIPRTPTPDVKRNISPSPHGAIDSPASVSSAKPQDWKMWQPATERLQHFQTMLKSKLNVLTLKKEPLPAVIFHEPEAIELCTTTPLMKTRTHSGCKVTYLGKVSTTGMQFLSGCTEKPVIELWKKHTLAREDVFPANALLEIRPFQVWLHHLDHKGEATVHMDTFQVARIAYCTADHNVSPNIFAWVYREINDDLSYQMDCHAVECESKLEAKKLAHAMMEAFRKTFHSMKSDGRIHSNSSSEEVSQELESDDG
ncbi:PTB-containing, cubilin and LRP1-interacting protein isoform X1 [Trachypithecus francoisi]|uniref:PTB-containing, cubilin and LRP1-interacting protein isoform X1 n=2 Tax=Trachypithecus francoisi TaxID=54180 RepID=UPI00141AABD3|nr:PTB-containing, cubilin and LRP1-interacting protein isoform X1 [Trachypithecus francoisi]